MIAIDSDVLAVHHIFVNDARFPENLRFMERSANYERGVTIYNLLELCGILSSADKAVEARMLFQRYLTAADMQVLYPPVHLESPAEYWAVHNEELMQRIMRGMRLGDAVVLWVAESVNCEAIVTWNKRHFDGKTSLQLYTPSEWLKVTGQS